MGFESPGSIGPYSSETEMWVDLTPAEEVMRLRHDFTGGGLLVSEVNNIHALEVEASMFYGVWDLNTFHRDSMRQIYGTVADHGGRFYGGGSVLRDTEGVLPTILGGTVTLSRSMAKVWKRIGSHQIVIGTYSEQDLLNIYKVFRFLNPILSAISASSPFVAREGILVDSGFKSLRPQAYKEGAQHLPPEMIGTPPYVQSVSDYRAYMTRMSQEVLRRYHAGQLDVRGPEVQHFMANFQGLNPSQVFPWERIRFDYTSRGGYALEVRIQDTPITLGRTYDLNVFDVGLVYFTRLFGQGAVQRVRWILGNPDRDAINDGIFSASKSGLDGKYIDTPVRDLLPEFFRYSREGFEEIKPYGWRELVERLRRFETDLATTGNEADVLLRLRQDGKIDLANQGQVIEFLHGMVLDEGSA